MEYKEFGKRVLDIRSLSNKPLEKKIKKLFNDISIPMQLPVKPDFCKHKLEILFTEGFNIIDALSIHLTEDETRGAKNLLRKKYKELTA